MKLYEKKPRELEQNPFTLPDNPAVIAAGENGDAVSAPQGAFGVFAGRPCAFLFLPRDSRVCALLEAGKPCSISFFDTPAFRDSLNALARYGTLDAVGLTAAREGEIPYCEEADTVFLCRSVCMRGAEEPEKETVLFFCEITRTLRKRPGFKDRLVGCC